MHHSENFKFLRIEHIRAIMNFRTYLCYQYYNCSIGPWICRKQKKYEILERMKYPYYYIWQKKYENLVEPSRASQARLFFSLLIISCQIFILIQSLSQTWPLLHTFSISLSKFAKFSYFISSKFARFAYFFSLLVKFARLSYFFNLLKIWQIT